MANNVNLYACEQMYATNALHNMYANSCNGYNRQEITRIDCENDASLMRNAEKSVHQISSDNQNRKKKKNGKSTYKHIPHREKPPHLVARRNARERRRVQAVNSAFARLRKAVPVENRTKRLSKVKTLQKAIEYIHNLMNLLNKADQIDYSSMISLHASIVSPTSTAVSPASTVLSPTSVNYSTMNSSFQDYYFNPCHADKMDLSGYM